MMPSPARELASPWYAVGATVVGFWIVGVTTVMTLVRWFVGEVASEQETAVPGWFQMAAPLATAVLTAGASLVLWRAARRHARVQRGAVAAGRAWTVLGLVAAMLGCAQTVPLPQNEAFLAVTAAVAAVAVVAVTRRGATGSTGGPRDDLPWALVAAAVAVIPWLWLGSMGGVVETLAAVGAAATVGWVASGVLTAGFFDAFGRSRTVRVFVGGLAAGVALAPLGASVGRPGLNIAELVAVPAAGFTMAALSAFNRYVQRVSVAIVAAAAIAGPIVFVDPEETSLVLGLSDIGAWTAVATVVATTTLLLVGVVYGAFLRRRHRRRRWVPAIAVVAAVLGASSVYAAAGHPGFYGERLFVVMAEQADLSGLAAIPDRTTRLSATYRRLVATADRTQARLREHLDRLHLSYTPYYLVNGMLVDASPALRPYISRLPGVGRVLIDQRLRPVPQPPQAERGTDHQPSGDPQWNIQAIGAQRVWSELHDTGVGIVIGTSDSGIDGTHPALAQSYRGGADSWFDPWNGTIAPTDHNGHGTHTLGTAVGRDGIGVAPGAQWIGCVNLDRNLGSPSHSIDCLQFRLAPFPRGGDPERDGRPSRAPHILTNSWGCPPVEGCDLDALRPATAALAAAGIYVVAAAGNSGPSCGTITDPPAPYLDVLTVGATDSSNSVASFSSRGPTSDGTSKPDVFAPGVDVLSALPGGTYGVLDGTSMATPHLAGTVALMWSANPRLIGDIDATTNILRATATPLAPDHTTECGGDTAQAGVVDAFTAVQAAVARR